MTPLHSVFSELLFCAAAGVSAQGTGVSVPPPPPATNSVAQDAQTTEDDPQGSPSAPSDPQSLPDTGDSDILVTGAPERGSVVGSIPPEQTFTPFEISTYNATDIGTLVQNLGPLATSIRGGQESGPIVLLNGRRISSFADIARIPTGAIERMEVFPEALALAYGFRPNQKVLNIVTFEHFAKQNVETNLVVPTEGGRVDGQILGSLLRLSNDTRINIDTSYRKAGALVESERNLLAIGDGTGSAEFRTLVPETERFSLNGSVSSSLDSGVAASLNGRFETESNRFLLGVQPAGVLSREIVSDGFHVGAALDGQRAKWNWSVTANLDRNHADIINRTSDAALPQDQTTSSSTTSDVQLVLGGPLATLPAGNATVSLRAGLGSLDFLATSMSGGASRQTELERRRVAFQRSLDVPIASSRAGPAWLGILSANANVAVEHLSDTGSLATYGGGLNWKPFENLTIFASYNDEERAPSVEQLGAAQLSTPLYRVYDFSRGETVDVTRISGGNLLLRTEDRKEFSLGLYSKPISSIDLTLSANYVDTSIDRPIATFASINPDIESLFPEKFLRGPDGRLIGLDARPLNFSSARQRTLRSGISFAHQLTKAPPPPEGTVYSKIETFPDEATQRANLPPGTIVYEAIPGSDDLRRIESLSSRITVALYHTWKLTDEITPRAGGPTFDLLDGYGTDIGAFTPRHQFSFQAGLFRSWFGARLTVDWRSKSTTRSLPSVPFSADRELTSSASTTVNFSVFATPAEKLGGIKAPAWITGTRVALSVTNLFNTRPQVVDRNGVTPLIYQPAYLNPLGRTLAISLRKVF